MSYLEECVFIKYFVLVSKEYCEAPHFSTSFFFLAQAGLELVILLPHPLRLVDYRRAPP
jgi:hypothetical protein